MSSVEDQNHPRKIYTHSDTLYYLEGLNIVICGPPSYMFVINIEDKPPCWSLMNLRQRLVSVVRMNVK